jgi:ribonuclease HI
MRIEVWADGSSNGKSGSAIGWGWVILSVNGAGIVKVLAQGKGGLPEGTNNVAELMGAREGLRFLASYATIEELKGWDITLVSDSQYVLGLANGSSSPSKNVALAEHLRAICKVYGVKTRWVRGHDGNEFNEMCDRLAKAGKEDQKP